MSSRILAQWSTARPGFTGICARPPCVAPGLTLLAQLIAGVFGCGSDHARWSTPITPGELSAGADRARLQATWALETASPEWAHAGPFGLQGCAGYERSLMEVAGLIADRRATGVPGLDAADVALELRARGSPHVWPRVWTHEAAGATPESVERAFEAWLGELPEATTRRCGVAHARGRSGSYVTTVAMVEPLADLDRLPTTARTGQWLRLSARLSEAALAAKVVLLGPRGAPRTAPTRFSPGSARADFSLDQPGLWRSQLLVDTAKGPRPALEAWIFVDEPPRREAAAGPAPGELEVALGAAPSAWRGALLAMLDGARASEQLPPLTRDARLDALAQAHAEAMRRSGQAAHDAGDGSPSERVSRAAYPAYRVGENVAQAASLARAHRALWNSPSHRGNLLDTGFDRVGLGVVVEPTGDPEATAGSAEPDDTLQDELREAHTSVSRPASIAPRVWVCQLFVDSAPVKNAAEVAHRVGSR